MRYSHAKCTNPVETKILLTKFNQAYEVDQIIKIRLHSNGGSQVKCVRKLSREVDFGDQMRPTVRWLLTNGLIEDLHTRPALAID